MRQQKPTPNWKEISLAGTNWPEDLVVPQDDKLRKDSESVLESMSGSPGLN